MSKGDVKLGRKLRERRESLGLTLTFIARMSGVSAPYLSQVENGKEHPAYNTLARIIFSMETANLHQQ